MELSSLVRELLECFINRWVVAGIIFISGAKWGKLKAEVTDVICRIKNQRSNSKREGLVHLPDKTADISRRHHWFPRELTSEKRVHKFHTDDVPLPILITASVSGWWGRGEGLAVRGVSHINVTRMLFSKLMGVNCSFGSQDRKLTFLCIQISRWVVYKKYYHIPSYCFKDSI